MPRTSAGVGETMGEPSSRSITAIAPIRRWPSPCGNLASISATSSCDLRSSFPNA
jgi:hypothetical protein